MLIPLYKEAVRIPPEKRKELEENLRRRREVDYTVDKEIREKPSHEINYSL